MPQPLTLTCGFSACCNRAIGTGAFDCCRHARPPRGIYFSSHCIQSPGGIPAELKVCEVRTLTGRALVGTSEKPYREKKLGQFPVASTARWHPSERARIRTAETKCFAIPRSRYSRSTATKQTTTTSACRSPPAQPTTRPSITAIWNIFGSKGALLVKPHSCSTLVISGRSAVAAELICKALIIVALRPTSSILRNVLT